MSRQQSYTDAARTDRRGLLREFDASTEEEDKHWRTASIGEERQSRWRAGLEALAGYRWFITTGVLMIILGLQLVILNRTRGTKACSPQVGGSYVEKTQSCSSPFVGRHQWHLVDASHSSDRGRAMEGGL